MFMRRGASPRASTTPQPPPRQGTSDTFRLLVPPRATRRRSSVRES
ncbi:hypothetical protein Ctob_006146 [Chrysochromulina tobinii]|uniref:Uncharacterized protein n=1 Tax=Chrysochromulina tobinii TaxID=1460289 RepID=A0A0M0JLF8_9EUKA|nr:hypothetical protein Ctob_006146 [Chrysochromulina tobinii]|eukprot:KOO27088.1 hypothetical protein Ctob_006146 [Chrysochromulina sp. CCMP291]